MSAESGEASEAFVGEPTFLLRLHLGKSEMGRRKDFSLFRFSSDWKEEEEEEESKTVDSSDWCGNIRLNHSTLPHKVSE